MWIQNILIPRIHPEWVLVIISIFFPFSFFYTLQPLSPADLVGEIEYADVNFSSNYGPINYKQASIYALVKKQKNSGLKEMKKE